MSSEIVSTAARPDLAETTGRWRWDAFARHGGATLEDVLRREHAAAAGAVLMPQTLVLLDAGEPIGMASLCAHDLDEKPDLTPWLAGVFVAEHARRKGSAARLVAAVEGLAAEATIPTLWLYTRTAESLYARLGWRTVETVMHRDAGYALMRRELSP